MVVEVAQDLCLTGPGARVVGCMVVGRTVMSSRTMILRGGYCYGMKSIFIISFLFLFFYFLLKKNLSIKNHTNTNIGIFLLFVTIFSYYF